MLQKTATITWRPLSKAYEHVLKFERSRELTEWRLRRMLGERKPGVPQVRCRAGCVIAPHQRPELRENVSLPGDFWLFESDFVDDVRVAIVDWADDSGKLPSSHPFAPWSAYRIEVCWEDLIAIWPKKRSSAGRKPVHDQKAILAEARAYLRTHARPKSLDQFAAKMEDLLSSKSIDGNYPRRTYLTKLLKPLFESAN
jgi:hypothetical protein